MMGHEADHTPWEDGPGRPLPFWSSLRRDLIAHVPPEGRGMSRWGWARTAILVGLGSSGFHVVGLYRLAHALRQRAGGPGKAMAGLIFWTIRHAYGCTIAPSARLHAPLILPHPQGIVIGAGVVVGPRAWIYQNVTLGGAPGKSGLPRVGADARIYAGAVLAGPIVVGDNVLIAANAVVHRDVPPRTAVRPAMVEYGPLPAHGVARGDEPGVDPATLEDRD